MDFIAEDKTFPYRAAKKKLSSLDKTGPFVAEMTGLW